MIQQQTIYLPVDRSESYYLFELNRHLGITAEYKCDLEKQENKIVLEADTTLELLKELKNYFGEHDKTNQEHRLYFTISNLIKHL